MATRGWKAWVLVATLLVAAGLPVLSEDVEKRWRIGLHAGFYDTGDSVPSDSANVLVLLDEDNTVARALFDPRNDDAALGEFKIQSATRALLTGQYAVNKILVLEGAIGYHRGDVGDIEMQAQFFGVDIPITQNFLFEVFRFSAGEMEQVPIQLSAMARFRPRSNFNPYLGGGIGYILVGFEPSQDLNDLSVALDSTLGGFAPLDSVGANLGNPSELEDLSGFTVEAPDSFEWHLLGGTEYTFKKKWALYLDFRYVFASRRFSLRVNGGDQLGVSVPSRTEEFGSPLADNSLFGAYSLVDGLIDGGRVRPVDPLVPEEEWGDYCAVGANECFFENVGDGVPDPGYYYIKGGSVKYGGYSVGFGVRYTF